MHPWSACAGRCPGASSTRGMPPSVSVVSIDHGKSRGSERKREKTYVGMNRSRKTLGLKETQRSASVELRGQHVTTTALTHLLLAFAPILLRKVAVIHLVLLGCHLLDPDS